MIGIDGSKGRPFSPWHAVQTDALSSIESAQATFAAERSAATTTLRNMRGNPSRPRSRPFGVGHASRSNKKAAPLDRTGRPTKCDGVLLDREGDDGVAALGVDLGVAAR